MIDIIESSITIINKNSGICYFVGGSVRDFIIHNKSTKLNLEDFISYIVKFDKDIDIATNLKPDVINNIFTNNGFFVKTTLVTNVVVKNKTKLEITTFRKDINPNGRWTQIEFANTIHEDSNRRDFTINAIYLRPDLQNNQYELCDFHNGLEHIKTNTVKFIGNAEQRIKEDYLRMLRFFRFSCRFSSNFDDDGLVACKNLKLLYKQACVENADGLRLLAKERIKDEIFKILNHYNYKSFLDCVATNDLSDAFFGIDDAIFNKRLNAFYLATQTITKVISNFSFDALFCFICLAGTNQDIIILSRKEENLIKLITNKNDIETIFNDAGSRFFNQHTRLKNLFLSYNKQDSVSITKKNFFECLICYIIINNRNNEDNLFVSQIENLIKVFIECFVSLD